MPWLLNRVVYFACFSLSKDCSAYICMLTKQNSFILKIEIVCSPKLRRNQRCYVVWKHKTRSSFEKYPQWKSENFIKYLLHYPLVYMTWIFQTYISKNVFFHSLIWPHTEEVILCMEVLGFRAYKLCFYLAHCDSELTHWQDMLPSKPG